MSDLVRVAWLDEARHMWQRLRPNPTDGIRPGVPENVAESVCCGPSTPDPASTDPGAVGGARNGDRLTRRPLTEGAR